jgi:hypothetical protein
MKECTRDEAFERLLGKLDTNIALYKLNQELQWWLDWANRRCDQVDTKLVEALQKIVENTEDDARYIAQQALLHNGYTGPKGDETHVSKRSRPPDNS